MFCVLLQRRETGRAAGKGEACSLSPKGSPTAVALGPLVRLPTSPHLADTTNLLLQG